MELRWMAQTGLLLYPNFFFLLQTTTWAAVGTALCFLRELLQAAFFLNRTCLSGRHWGACLEDVE